MYSVLRFPEPDSTEVVPTSWVDERKMITKWPPYKEPEKVLKAVRKCFIPEDNWPEYTYALLVCKCGKLRIVLMRFKYLITPFNRYMKEISLF